MRAVEKDRQRRYQTPADLADDISNFLQDRPITASPPRRTYLFGKFIRRHRAAALAGTLLLGLLVVGLALSIAQLRAIRAARDQTEWLRSASDMDTLLAVADFVGNIRIKQVGKVNDWFAIHKRPHHVPSIALSPDGRHLAFVESRKDQMTAGLWTPDRNLLREVEIADGHDLSGFNCRVAFAKDGLRFAVADKSGVVVVSDVESMKEVASIRTHGEIRSLAFSVDGKHIVDFRWWYSIVAGWPHVRNRSRNQPHHFDRCVFG